MKTPGTFPGRLALVKEAIPNCTQLLPARHTSGPPESPCHIVTNKFEVSSFAFDEFGHLDLGGNIILFKG